MKKYNIFLFDLDGTLTDSSEGIFKSIEYALDKFGVDIGEEKNRLIGPPLKYSFQTFYGFSKEKAEEGARYYRERYAVKGMFENRVYDGIEDMLSALKAAGKTVLVATSKPEVFARTIIEHFHLDQYFDYVAGSAIHGYPETKADVIEYGLRSLNISDMSDVLMVGDRLHDVQGAHSFQIDCLGILYGFGTREELEAAGADYIEEKVEDILKYM